MQFDASLTTGKRNVNERSRRLKKKKSNKITSFSASVSTILFFTSHLVATNKTLLVLLPRYRSRSFNQRSASKYDSPLDTSTTIRQSYIHKSQRYQKLSDGTFKNAYFNSSIITPRQLAKLFLVCSIKKNQLGCCLVFPYSCEPSVPCVRVFQDKALRWPQTEVVLHPRTSLWLSTSKNRIEYIGFVEPSRQSSDVLPTPAFPSAMTCISQLISAHVQRVVHLMLTSFMPKARSARKD